jgi:Spy/CpxP family protein refolding chaperone
MSNKFIRQGLVAALLVTCAMPALTRAQDATQGSNQEQAAPAQAAPNRPNLNLTDDQKAQMKKIREDAKSQIDAVNNDSSLSVDQKQAKIKQIHRDSHKQVMAMLTPEQRKTMRQWRHEHRGEKNAQAPSAS